MSLAEEYSALLCRLDTAVVESQLVQHEYVRLVADISMMEDLADLRSIAMDWLVLMSLGFCPCGGRPGH